MESALKSTQMFASSFYISAFIVSLGVSTFTSFFKCGPFHPLLYHLHWPLWLYAHSFRRDSSAAWCVSGPHEVLRGQRGWSKGLASVVGNICVYSLLYLSAWATVTIPQTGCLTNRNVFPHSSRGRWAKVKVLARLVSGEPFRITCRWPPSCCVLTCPFLSAWALLMSPPPLTGTLVLLDYGLI